MPADVRRKDPSALGFGTRALGACLADLAVLIAALLVAGHLRHTLPFGTTLGADDRWPGPLAYLILALALTATCPLRLVAEPAPSVRSARRFWAPVGAVALAALGLAALRPGQPRLHTAYFVVVAVGLLVLTVPWPTNQANADERPGLGANLARLWANRALLRIWVGYNVRSRYSETILGVLWIALLPLSTALVMSIVFSRIMRVPVGDVPFTAFLLAGIVPWGLFNQAIAGGMRSILGAMGLINQINFPREILVLSALGEALVDAGLMFLAMVIVNATLGVWPNPLYVALPLLVAIQVAFTLGLMLVVSWLSVLVRDVPQLVSVLLQLTFYLSAVIYPASIVPERFRLLLTLNPMAVLIEAYRDVIVYARPPDWAALLYPAALAVGVLVFGYRLFKAHEDTLADLV